MGEETNQLEKDLNSQSNNSNEKHICYTPEDILNEAKDNNIREKYPIGFEKEIPFREAPPFFQAPPRRYNSNYSSE